MRELLLLAGVLIFMALGFFLVGGLDCALDRHQKRKQKVPALRIALENPAMLESITQLLEDFSRRHPAWEIYLYYGARDEILRQLEQRLVDVALLTGRGETGSGNRHVVPLPVKQSGVSSKALDMELAPLDDAETGLEAVWYEDTGANRAIQNFETMLTAACLCGQD